MNESVWGPAQQQMTDLLSGHPDDVPAVVDQLTELQAVLCQVPPLMRQNPLCEFNSRYLTITENVLERLYEGDFRDPAFVSRLNVEFAARYFDALRAWAGTGTSPRCPQVWACLFQRIGGPDCPPLPSTCAGVNAQISFDLPFALVTTFDHFGTDPVDDSDQHHDYLALNDIFAASIPGLDPGHLGRWQVLIDTMNDRLDGWWQGGTEEYTRNVAWRNAQKLWDVRHDMAATDRERSTLDRSAAGLNKLLLSPLGSFLQ